MIATVTAAFKPQTTTSAAASDVARIFGDAREPLTPATAQQDDMAAQSASARRDLIDALRSFATVCPQNEWRELNEGQAYYRILGLLRRAELEMGR